MITVSTMEVIVYSGVEHVILFRSGLIHKKDCPTLETGLGGILVNSLRIGLVVGTFFFIFASSFQQKQFTTREEQPLRQDAQQKVRAAVAVNQLLGGILVNITRGLSIAYDMSARQFEERDELRGGEGSLWTTSPTRMSRVAVGTIGVVTAKQPIKRRLALLLTALFVIPRTL